MPHRSPFRVRVWTQSDLRPAPGSDPQGAAAKATAGNPGRAVTAEAEGGAGIVLATAIGVGGGAGIWVQPGTPTDFDPSQVVVRVWDVEDAYEEMGASDMPSALLSEFHEGLWEDGRRGVRLLTAEESDEDGTPVIVAVSWFDSLEYEASLPDSLDNVDD